MKKTGATEQWTCIRYIIHVYVNKNTNMHVFCMREKVPPLRDSRMALEGTM